VKERSEAAAIELVMASRRMRRARSRSRAFLATPLGSGLVCRAHSRRPVVQGGELAQSAGRLPLARHGRAHPTVSRAIFISPDGKLEYTSADILRRGGAAWSPDIARMADMSWPDANRQFCRGWKYFPPAGINADRDYFPPAPRRAPRIRACHDRAVLNGRGGVLPPFGVSWALGREERS
jgi:hypothetical protein